MQCFGDDTIFLSGVFTCIFLQPGDNRKSLGECTTDIALFFVVFFLTEYKKANAIIPIFLCYKGLYFYVIFLFY